MPEETTNPISTEISRIQGARDTLRTKAVELSIAESTAKIDALATAFNAIPNVGSVNVNVKEGETYTIPKGYHNGSGTVAGVAGGGNYSLQEKTVTPTKSQQNVVSDEGYYGLSSVTVGAIPEAYQNVSSVTATASNVLAGKVIVDAKGNVVTGTMANNGAVTKTLTAAAPSYTVPAGYHSGTGTVTISTESKTATPTKNTQTINPTAGKVLASVTVNAIPDNFTDSSTATATADQILDGQTAWVNNAEVTGTMPSNTAANTVLDATTGKQTYTIPKGYHDGKGTVKVVLEEKSITPTKSSQNVTPTAGKVLGKVTVDAIPAQYITTTDATAVAANILAGKTAYVNGSKVTGTMVNNSSVSATIDGITKTSVAIPAGYTTGGTISLTNDIETLLAAI